MEIPLWTDSMLEHTQNSLAIISLKEDLNIQQVISYTDRGGEGGEDNNKIIKG